VAGGPRTWVHLYEFAARDNAGARATLDGILSDYDEACWSLSHSGGLAAVAVAPRPVGVDIEVERERRRLMRVAERMFAADELELLEAAEGPTRQRMFHRCWVAKEAYAKGLGLGLALPFASFSVAAALRAPDGIGPVGEDWTVAISSRGQAHLAVAVG
jgi:4'-phosphopantetheinyl transferase